MILMICGYSKAGKDYIANKIKEKYPEVILYSFAKHLKEIVACSHGISVEELEERKEEFPCYFVSRFHDFMLNNNFESEQIIIITDCRYDIEFEIKVHMHGSHMMGETSFHDFKSVFVERNKVNTNCGCEINPEKCDYIYDNNGEFDIKFFEKILEL